MSDQQREYQRAYYQANKERMRIPRRYAQRRYANRLRLDVLEILGGKCRGCGTTDHRVLQVDHIGGNGNLERKRTYREAILQKIRQGEIGGYQLLCANCNWIKRLEQGESSDKESNTKV